MKSKFLSIRWYDVFKGVVTAFFSMFFSSLVQSLATGTMPNLQTLKVSSIVGASATLGYLTKQFFTNSEGQMLKKEE